MSISNNAEKAFEVIQHPFMIKTLSDIEIQGNFLNSIKAIYKIPTVNVMFNGEILNAFPQVQKQGKDVYSYHFYLAQFYKFNPVQ